MTMLKTSHDSFRGRIGISRTDITPPVGIYARNWGAARHDLAESVHRPLWLTVMTLESLEDGRRLVYLDADLGWWRTLETFRRFQGRLLEAFPVEDADLIIALSHTHSGPPLMEPDPSLPGSALLKVWMDSLPDLAITAVRKAIATASEATLDWQTGHCGLATVRDLPDPAPERDRILCGYHPEGRPDDTLLVGRITDAGGAVQATLVNYACHPTTLAWDNRAISPDYVGAMRDTIHSATGAPALFLLGACGELAPRHQYVGDPAVADQHGRQLGHAALSTLAGMDPPGTCFVYRGTVESGAPLAVWGHEPGRPSTVLRSLRATVKLPLQDWPTAAELERQRQSCTDRALEERLRRKLSIRRGLGDGTTFDLPIYAWRMGDAVLVGSCCEAYSLLQTELRRRFPGRSIICQNLINGSIGYLPPSDLYEQEIYPVWQTPFGRGSLELVLEAMTSLVAELVADQP